MLVSRRCCLSPNEGPRGGRCKTWWVVTPGDKAAPKIHLTCILAPRTDSRIIVVGRNKPEVGGNTLLCHTMHQRAPEVHLLHSRPLGVEVLHAVPRAARARLGAEKTDPHAVKFVTSYDVCEEEKSKMAQGKLAEEGSGCQKIRRCCTPQN